MNLFDASVLMSVYGKEIPEYLDESLKSINDQTLKPKEIILVQDGPIPRELNLVISKWRKSFGEEDIKFEIVRLNSNFGLGIALNKGLEKCSCKWVIRMDSDDIAINTRFSELFDFISNNKCNIVGAYIEEFDQFSKKKLGVRKVKQDHLQIFKDMGFRNPMNHVSVMFQKSDVQKSGGYMDFPFFEDYNLWVRMYLNGCKFRNIPKVHVKVRAGENMLLRRSGLNYALQEMRFQKFLIENGIINELLFLRNILTRFMVRLAPKFVLLVAYKIARSNK